MPLESIQRWTKYWDEPSGAYFYFNSETSESTYEPPLSYRSDSGESGGQIDLGEGGAREEGGITDGVQGGGKRELDERFTAVADDVPDTRNRGGEGELG